MRRVLKIAGKKVLDFFRQFFGTLLDLIYPPLCHLCHNRIDNPNQIVCDACWNELPVVEIGRIHFRHKTLSDCPELPALAVWQFEGQTPQIIHLFKYQGFTRLAQRLGQQMAQAVLGEINFAQADCLIPVPLHAIRERERTYNQSRLLCDEISKITRQPVLNNVLLRIKNTKTQTKLNAEARLTNTKNAFRVNSPQQVAGKSVILVDDVLTTGATLTQCALRLYEAGARQVQILTAVRV
jgi:ComF family protein